MVTANKDFERIGTDEPQAYGIWNFKPLNSLKREVTFLVDGLVEEHAPYVLCAALKTMKSRILVDLAVSLASGGKFLGVYPCKQSKVLFACAEDGEPLITRNIDLVSSSRNIKSSDLNNVLRVMAHGGKIDNTSLKHLERLLRKSGSGTCLIIDPAKDFFGGLDPAKEELSFLLGQLRDTCRRCDTTLVLSCHATKAAETLGFEMMRGTCFSNGAGGWWLMRRRGSYKFDGLHNLQVQFGGRTGYAGKLSIVLDERFVDGQPTGHKVLVTRNDETIVAGQDEIEVAILEMLSTQQLSCNAVLRKLKEAGMSVSQAKVNSKLNGLRDSGKLKSVPSKSKGKDILKYSCHFSND